MTTKSNAQQGNTPISYAIEARFKKPAEISYSIPGSLLSILSLLFMAVLSTLMYVQLTEPQQAFLPWLSDLLPFLKPPKTDSALATWAWLPFAFTIFGSALGMIFELWLLLTGQAFQQTNTPFHRFIRNIRLLNLGPVVATILFFFICILITDPSMRLVLLYLSGAIAFGLGFALFFNGAPGFVFIMLAGLQVTQIILVLTHSIPFGGSAVAYLLVAQSVLQLTALLITTATPLKSTGFHTLSTISGVCLYVALVKITNASPNFSHDVAVSLPQWSVLWWGFIVVCLAAMVAVGYAFPKVFQAFRTVFSHAIWTLQYFVLVSAKRFPKPFNLSQVYNNTNDRPVASRLKPYYQVHSQYLMKDLSIPADEDIERNVTIFKKLLNKATKGFKAIAMLDHVIPQSNVNTPLADKQRMAIWSDGRDFWPKFFSRKLFGYTLPDRGHFETTPEPVIKAFKEGQLLAYLVESGVGSPFLTAREGGGLEVDFSYLEHFETKADFEAYGGGAHFAINNDLKKLQLTAVVAPSSGKVISANPHDPEFRAVEAQVLASLYYEVISGKHLAEIHMTYNLVEVTMHNAFDVQGQWQHPFRTFMYLHLFSHELAEEITTEHLVQDGAVFSQIFATTHDGMIDHLNHTYANFEYGTDENFEYRKQLMLDDDNDVLPNSAINWELKYAEIWHKYTSNLIDVIYADDEAVVNDKYLQDFHDGLNLVMLKGLPERYDDFKTKSGVARFASDTIHHLVIRHQVYGTTGIRAALDPRISKTQVPKDGSTYAVDDWRSLAYVALATGKARFTLLLDDFTYLLEGVDEKFAKPMHQIFNQLQEDLRILEAEWNTTEEEKTFNYNYFRAVPSGLHTGPGY
ncbi:hypothetical protein OS175_07360 [Marinicella sp. S1101]|uniref:hypothetical protein n=1 Tax=Marinicella marina TaxID=2996016 RepID=UPI002260D4C0|nr:hypothetical protein [Marinicella marina]MCX7553692.1 hypothetical protein [Marinicella marina]MDJ1140782.1 hypothetical protein [Marinicella marina]